MIRLLARSIIALVFTASLASNALLLTSTAFNTALSGLLATTLGVRTVSAGLSAKLSASQAQAGARRSAAKSFGRRLSARTTRVATRSLAAVPAEAVPYLGAAVIVGTVTYELYAACETLGDLSTLYLDLGIEEEIPKDALTFVCDPSSWSNVLSPFPTS